MEEQVYVQAIAIKMKLPDGEVAVGKFLGIALCPPEQWDEIVNSDKPLQEWMAGGESLLFQRPLPLEEAMAGKENYNDIIDMVREELRDQHHETLKEKDDN